jgi:hypothetical protein
MSYMLYCVFRGPLPAALELPDGVGGHRVFTADYNGLGVALSELPEPDSPPDISKHLVYETVIESFRRHLTVIPMRYGRRVECPYEAIVLLRENYAAYGALLHELEGLAEMGIQVLPGYPRTEAETDSLAIPPERLPPLSGVSGTA